MSKDGISYLIFIIALIVSFVLDLFVFSKKDKEVSIKSATYQYCFWVAIAMCYFVYLLFEFDSKIALDYLSAYFMEMSLSIDNIFVFVLIFSSLQIHKNNVGRVLMIGVALAIIFRIIFIAVGIILVTKFSWLLYVFGAFLLYTGFKLFFGNPEEENDVKDGGIYKFIRKYLRYTETEPNGKFVIQKDGKAFFTKLFLAILIIGVTDIVFALDSIPAVFAITTNNLVVFSSNIFAVLGLRALFFILQKAADQFDYLQQGIAIVLIFIGAKMFLGLINIHFPTWISLVVIVACISGSIFYSMYHNRKKSKLTHDTN
jgi:tellurite resistance protein TerC